MGTVASSVLAVPRIAVCKRYSAPYLFLRNDLAKQRERNMASPTLGKVPPTQFEAQDVSSSLEARVPRHSGILQNDLVDQLQEPVLALDLHGNIVGCNYAALQAYGYSETELLGQNLSLLYSEAEQIAWTAVFAGILETSQYRCDLRTRAKSGKDLFIHLSLSALRDAECRLIGIAAILTDVTEQTLLQQAVRDSGHRRKLDASSAPGHGEHIERGERQINGTRFLIDSPVMHKFMTMVDRVAANPEIVLITGETGCGKELIARSVHDGSARRNHPFVDINCAALPEQLVESELFGYEKGAFSGADASKPGLFELANQGTLFLDEIGELDTKLQVKLLRVLDGSPYYRLGGHRKISVDVRIVAATNQNLEQAVEEGRFRRDLFHRLSQYQLRVPPLRERPEDVFALAEHFLVLKNQDLRFSSEALSALACYSWPGNVRELRNLVAKLAMSAAGPEISSNDLLSETSGRSTHKAAPLVPSTNLDSMEEQMIIKALESTGGHRGLAAEQLGISRRTLSRKLREYNIDCPHDNRGQALGAMGQEQQKLFRAKTRFLVSIQNPEGHEVTVTAVNLSTGGLGLDGITDPQRLRGLLDVRFLLPESNTLIEAKARIVWTDANGRAGARFAVLEPALYEVIHHWTADKMKEEGWELHD
jgi:two-component system, NtrC family, response regulator AtoC